MDSWVGLTYDVLLYCPDAQPILPTSHQPKQNQAEGGTAKIILSQPNPTIRPDGDPCSKTLIEVISLVVWISFSYQGPAKVNVIYELLIKILPSSGLAAINTTRYHRTQQFTS